VAVARMTVCEWQGPNVKKQVITSPTLAQVEAAIRRLDNAGFNDLYLEPIAEDTETWLCIGGGAGRYLVSGSLSNQRFPTLLDPARQAQPAEELVVGGQEGTYPRNQVHDLNTALRAAREFWSQGRFGGAGLHWIDT
jgi:hypothetical protein